MMFRRLGIAALFLTAGIAVAQEKPKPAATTETRFVVPLVPAAPAAQPAPAGKADEPSHKLIGAVSVKSTDPMAMAGPNAAALQTLCLDTDGRVLGLVAAAKPWGAPLKGATAEVHVFDAAGKPVTSYKVPFHGQAINCAPNGTVFVAGDGKVAKFDKTGKMIGEVVELPHISDLLKDQVELKKKAEAQLVTEKKQFTESITNAKKQFAERIAELEKKKPDDRSKTEARQLEQYKALLKQYDEMESERKGRTVEIVLGEMVGRVRVINAVAVSEKDVFLVCGDIGTYGYAVWRMTDELKEPKRVLGEVRGCCGQMDIQVYGNDLLVAENCNSQWARYDRDGKKIGGYGKRATNPGQADGGDAACFGGCCNPMNVRAQSATGDVFTAESEGIIKRYSPSGEFLGTAAKVKLTGGCKNVAIGVSADGKKLYFCDQPGSKFHIFEKQ